MDSGGSTLIGVLEAARVKGVHEETVRRAIRAGRLPALRASGRFVLRTADLDAWQPAYAKAPRSPAARRGRDGRLTGVAARAQEDGEPTAAARRPPGRHNLPVPLSSFVGREHAVAEVGHLLDTVRLLTLTGAGGVGKTRLAIEVASELAECLTDGVRFVDLAALVDASLVPQAVAEALGVRAVPRRPLVQTLVDVLLTKRLLLVLDNCEHLATACADLAQILLGACPGLRILATSREALGLTGETVWLVPSLSLPALTLHVTQDTKHLSDPEPLAGFEAVRLFVERATAASRGFVLTGQNAEVVARICRQLDGIPLAIELAAAWVKVLSVDEIAARLLAGPRFLMTGGRAVVPRHRTMTAAIDASYRLLTEPERRLFTQLSVFAGGWTLAAAEAVTAAEAVDQDTRPAAIRGVEPDSTLGLLARLVDKSLVVVEQGTNGDVRYRLLEPLRQFARERIEASGTAVVRDRHASYFLDLAEGAQGGLWGAAGATGAWVPQLVRENDNLRAALRWLIDRGDVERAERLGAALPRFWLFSGQVKEGRAWLTELLALSPDQPPTRARARLRVGAAAAALYETDTDACRALAEEGIALAREVDDDWAVAWALFLRITTDLPQSRGVPPPETRSRLDEGIAASRAAGDRVLEAMHLLTLCLVELAGGDDARAEDLAATALAMAEAAGAVREIARAQGCLGAINYHRGRLTAARELLERSRAIWQHGGERIEESFTLWSLALIAADQGDFASARAFITAMLEIWSALGRLSPLARAILQDFAYLAAVRGEHALALRVAGGLAADGLSPGVPRPYYGGSLDRCLELAREALGGRAAATAWEEGRQTSLARAMEIAAQALQKPDGPELSERRAARSRPVRPSGRLTAREREVAELVAHGLTNRRIAETLVIAEATAERHLSNIFAKLGLSSRAELAVWAATHAGPLPD